MKDWLPLLAFTALPFIPGGFTVLTWLCYLVGGVLLFYGTIGVLWLLWTLLVWIMEQKLA
jgi:hypothetical protein